jgi:hypothetical protein
MKNQYTIYRAGLKQHNISVVTEKEPNDDGIIIMSQDEYEKSLKSECIGDNEDWNVVTGNGMAVIYSKSEHKFNDSVIDKIVG